MTEMPEFVTQLEQASGLPWWCLLLLAVLVLIIIVLAASLSKAKKRARSSAVDIPRGASAAVSGETPADHAESTEGGEEETPNENDDSDDVNADSASDEAPEEKEPSEVEGVETQAADDEAHDAAVVDAEPSAVEPVADAGSEPKNETEPAHANEGTPAVPDTPEVEVVEAASKANSVQYDLDDDEILKAAGGNHSRTGQSAFGIDFGFLEEYESEYEHALEEFRRLRTDLDGNALPNKG